MIEKKFETVSQLVDDQITSDASLDAVTNDHELSDTWERYHLIGDVMRDDMGEKISLDLSNDIMNAIASEPTVLAPKKTASFTQSAKAKVIQLAKPFGQLAIAASAAGLVVLGVQTNVAENEAITPAAQVVQTIPLGGIADPVSFNYSSEDRASKKQAYLEQQRRFQALLADHQQQIKLSAVTEIADSQSQENKSEEKVENLPK